MSTQLRQLTTRQFRAVFAGVATLLLTLASVANAAPAPYGAYLGCYNIDRLGLSTQERVVRSTGVSNYKNCPATCSALNASMVIIATSRPNYECRCGYSVPAIAALTTATNCRPGGSGLAVFYRHSAATTQRCRVAEPPTNTSNWRVAYNQQNAVFGAGEVKLRMNGLDGGTRVEATYPRQTYGQFQARGRASCAFGVIGAYYLRSSDNYPNAPEDQFDEIDFELISWLGKPCSMWLNSFRGSQSNGETQYSRSQYRRILGWPDSRSTRDFATYTIDWQPGYVSWYVDGKLLKHSRQGDLGKNNRRFQVPTLPMRPTFSLWSDPSGNFGGALNPSEGPWEATFNSIRQVVCDRPAPATTPLGPSWMYA